MMLFSVNMLHHTRGASSRERNFTANEWKTSTWGTEMTKINVTEAFEQDDTHKQHTKKKAGLAMGFLFRAYIFCLLMM